MSESVAGTCHRCISLSLFQEIYAEIAWNFQASWRQHGHVGLYDFAPYEAARGCKLLLASGRRCHRPPLGGVDGSAGGVAAGLRGVVVDAAGPVHGC
eukprot:2760307-Pleurochrysis_carterae.AAC.1